MKIKKRFSKVVWIFLKIFLDFRKEFKIRKRHGFEYSRKKMSVIHLKRAKQLYLVATELGGVLIKLCQYLSTRRDIFPDPYIETLSKLQDNVPAIPFSQIKTIVDEEYLGKEYPFSRIDENPLASASLGQTHKATLKNGDVVVLKVLKPQIEKIIDTDFAILFYVFKIFSHFKIFQQFSEFNEVLEEFIRVTGDELDFKREVHVGKRFKESLKKFSYLKVPYVYEEYSNRRIIVMEFIDGVKITDVEKWKDKNNDKATLSRRIVEIYFEQFLVMKLIHFDPHPGNIFVLENNNLGLLDFGMSGEITEEMSDGIKNGLTALARKDYEKILNVFKDLGFLKKNTDINSLLPIMEYFFNEILESVSLEQNSMQNIDLSPVIDDLVEIIYTQPFKLPYEWAYIGRTVSTITGIISTIYPEFKIYNELEPYVNKLLKDNFTTLIEKAVEFVKSGFTDLINAPRKVNNFINNVERGNTKFKVDFEAIDNRINNLANIITRGISIGLCFLSGTVAYILHILNRPDGMIIFGSISFISLVFFLIYRKRTKREMIKKQMMK